MKYEIVKEGIVLHVCCGAAVGAAALAVLGR